MVASLSEAYDEMILAGNYITAKRLQSRQRGDDFVWTLTYGEMYMDVDTWTLSLLAARFRVDAIVLAPRESDMPLNEGHATAVEKALAEAGASCPVLIDA